MNVAVVGLSLISSIYTSTPTSGEENSESIFLQMCKVQKPIGYCEKQYWRQAEHNSFHIFSHFQNDQGTSQEAQNTLGRGRHCKFTKNVYHRVTACLWVSVVKHRIESVKISPWSLFSSQHVESWTLIPIITKTHAWFALHIVCAPLKPYFVVSPSSSPFSPNPFFFGTALQHQHSAAWGRQLYFYIALGIISEIARLSVGTVLWYFACVCGRASLCVCTCLYKAEKSTVCFLGANLTLWWQLLEKQASHCEL